MKKISIVSLILFMTLSMAGCTSVDYDDLKGKWYSKENNSSAELRDDKILSTYEDGSWDCQYNPRIKSNKIISDGTQYGSPIYEIIKEDGEYFLMYDGFRYARADDDLVNEVDK